MTERHPSRRRLLSLLGAGAIGGLAGCTGSDGTPTQRGRDTASPTGTGTDTPGSNGNGNGGGDGDGDGDATETDDEGPGGKSNHWHGRLFFEVNGELVDFRQPKYYYENIKDDNPDVVYFHFHKDPEDHGPNEWSNEKQLVTFDQALNLLPGIGYERRNGNHAVTYEGTTYDGGSSGTSVSIHEGTEAIDPTNHEVQHNDVFWVQITTEDSGRNVSPAHGGADLGTLVFDINNIRVDFSKDKYLGEDAGSDAFHFHDDGHPLLWYREGSVTLAEALNVLPGIGYDQSSGNHVIEYDDEDNVSHSRTFDGSSSKHEITIRQRTSDIDPTSYELQDSDIIWVYVHSSVVPDNEH